MGTPLDLFQRVQISTASISALAFHDERPAVLFTNYLIDLPKFEWKQEENQEEQSESVQAAAAESAG